MFQTLILALVVACVKAAHLEYQECLHEITHRNPEVSTYEMVWLCQNADANYHKKSKYAEYKAAGYSDVNIFNKYYAWDSDAPFTAYFSSQAYKDYSLELLVRSEVKNHHRSWDFVQRWKNGSNWRALSSLDPDDTDEAVAADIYLAYSRSETFVKENKFNHMITLGHQNYPPFNEEWSFGQFYVKTRGWNYIPNDAELASIVDDWRNSPDYQSFTKKKHIEHFLSMNGYKGNAYMRFCEKIDKPPAQNWGDFVVSCMNVPGFKDVDAKERMKAEVKRLGFKNRDNFEDFWKTFIASIDSQKLLANSMPPLGYSAKPGSGPCGCSHNAIGLYSCGDLCCTNSPYTSTDPSHQYYYKNGGTKSLDNLCFEDTSLDSLKLPSNSNPPPGYKAKDGSGTCTCNGNGGGLASCGDLCCTNSPYTSTDPSNQHYYKNGGTSSMKNLCFEK